MKRYHHLFGINLNWGPNQTHNYIGCQSVKNSSQPNNLLSTAPTSTHKIAHEI